MRLWRSLAWVVGLAILIGGCSGAASSPTPTPVVAASPSPTATPAGGSPPSPASPAAASAATSGIGSGKAFVMTGVLPAFPNVVNGNLDPTTFVTSITDQVPEVFVVYLLGAGFNGPIDSTWTDTDTAATFTHKEAPLAYPGTGPNWEWDSSNVKGGWLPAGHYTVTFTFVPTGETAIVPFTITPAPGETASPTPPTASPAPSATTASAGSPATRSAFALLRLSNSSDTTGPAPDPSTFIDSYTGASPAFNITFELADGLTGTVTCTVTKDGTSVLDGSLSIDYTASAGWGNFQVNSPGSWPTGDYLATLTYKPTGETATITIPVK